MDKKRMKYIPPMFNNSGSFTKPIAEHIEIGTSSDSDCDIVDSAEDNVISELKKPLKSAPLPEFPLAKQDLAVHRKKIDEVELWLDKAWSNQKGMPDFFTRQSSRPHSLASTSSTIDPLLANADEDVPSESTTIRSTPTPSRLGSRSANSTPYTRTPLKLQITINAAMSNIASYSEGGSMAAGVTNAILFMIAKDNVPLNITKQEGFKSVLKAAAPLYAPPSRKTITKLIDVKYELLSKDLSVELKKVNSVVIAADACTETMTTTSYLGVEMGSILDYVSFEVS